MFKHFDMVTRIALVIAIAQMCGNLACADELKPFDVSYAWKWHGVTVAISTLKLERQSEDTWAYSSKSEPKGLVAAMRSERPTQLSMVHIANDVVQPLSYSAEDGTSATNRDANVKFDWPNRRASGVYEDTPVDMPLALGTQDDLSAQLSMFVQLLKSKPPANSLIINKNSVREYRYIHESDATVATPFGQVRTEIYRSEREGSKRVTRFWCAPSKGYLPMKVEQRKGDSVEWTMEIQRLHRE